MKIKEGFVLRDICGQHVISAEGFSQMNFSKLITLNESAHYLWQSVEGKEFDAETLAGLLIEKYGIPEELAKTDAEKLLAKWMEIGIVE